MNIGIDANVMTIPYPCGVRNYGEMLIKSLSEIDKNNTYYIFVNKLIDIPKQKNFKLIILPGVPYFKRQIFLPLFVKKYKIDVFHYLEPYGSILLIHKNIITTVHDLNLNFNYPIPGKHFITRIYNEVTRYFVFKNTDTFLFPASAIREELENGFQPGIYNKNFKIIPEGIDPRFSRKKNFQRKGNYILSMGDFSPRKNIIKLIESYRLLEKNLRLKYNLYIICSTEKTSLKYWQFVKTYKLEGYVKIITGPSVASLKKLYSGALFFIYPSLYEGFGLPILEAMVCRCPVITSNYGAMKETAGGAAFLVNPRSINETSKSMIRLMNDKRLRSTLIKKGLKRAKEFSWKSTAQLTLYTYEELNRHS